MAIAFDAGSDGGYNGGSTTSLTFAHTCTGSDGLLIVAVLGDPTSDFISSVTYDGFTMTRELVRFAVALARYTYLYSLLGPSAGTHNVVITATATSDILSGAASYTGVKQTTQPDGTNTDVITYLSTPTGMTLSNTTGTNDSWCIGVFSGYSSSAAPVADQGTRRIYDVAFGTWGIFDTGAVSPAGTGTLQFHYPGASVNDIIGLIIGFKPEPGGGGGDTLMGQAMM